MAELRDGDAVVESCAWTTASGTEGHVYGRSRGSVFTSRVWTCGTAVTLTDTALGIKDQKSSGHNQNQQTRESGLTVSVILGSMAGTGPASRDGGRRSWVPWEEVWGSGQWRGILDDINGGDASPPLTSSGRMYTYHRARALRVYPKIYCQCLRINEFDGN
ncbi:hypothetical protein K435DRAFT_813760 [Dendrothele bispora CBS 962.96]|uniref:Uncharacterized protein n=1 Tax=Dendrothele bispora (strain CBS 962.96) TaxID=1314807 RepID=A0A4S8KKL8_DENBC|nr:hypothetical protein K435DRAFT_813760 [Dendrothele bispora CBS 962.96]